MWTARVFTLYPELFPGPLGSGLYKKALEKKLCLKLDYQWVVQKKDQSIKL